MTVLSFALFALMAAALVFVGFILGLRFAGHATADVLKEMERDGDVTLNRRRA